MGHVRSLKTRSCVAPPPPPLLENVEDKGSMQFKDDDEIPRLFCKSNEPIRTLRVTQDKGKEEIEIIAINANKSCGTDDIHPRLMKEIIDHISQPIALHLRKTMDTEKYTNNRNKQTLRLSSRKAKNILEKTIDLSAYPQLFTNFFYFFIYN